MVVVRCCRYGAYRSSTGDQVILYYYGTHRTTHDTVRDQVILKAPFCTVPVV